MSITTRSHIDRGRNLRGRSVAAQRSEKDRAGNQAAQSFDGSPESAQLRAMQLMADNSPRSAEFASLQAMADRSPQAVEQRKLIDGASGALIQRQGDEEELQMKADPSLIQRQGDEEDLQMKSGPIVIQRNGGGGGGGAGSSGGGGGASGGGGGASGGGGGASGGGGGGTELGNWFRATVLKYAESQGGIDERDHHYVTPTVVLGPVTAEFTADSVHQALREAPAAVTVPGAARGEGGGFLARREEGGTAVAMIGGPVTTTSDTDAGTLTNTVQPGHLLGGIVVESVSEVGGNVVASIEGRGFGNFAAANEAVGRSMFTGLLYAQGVYLREKLREGSGGGSK